MYMNTIMDIATYINMYMNIIMFMYAHGHGHVHAHVHVHTHVHVDFHVLGHGHGLFKPPSMTASMFVSMSKSMSCFIFMCLIIYM